MQQNSLAFFQPSDALPPPRFNFTFLPISANRFGSDKDVSFGVPKFLLDMYDATIGNTGKALTGQLGIPSVDNPAFTKAGRDMAMNTAYGGLLSSAVPKAMPFGSLSMSGLKPINIGVFPDIDPKDIRVTDNLPTVGSKDFPIENLIGKKITPIQADLMDAGRVYTGLDNVKVPPTVLQGGSKFSLIDKNKELDLAFASQGLGQASSIVRRGADLGAVTAMNPQSFGKLPTQVSNKNMRKIFVDQVRGEVEAGNISLQNLKKLDNLIKSVGQTKKGAEKLQDFVGFGSPQIYEYIDKIDFETAKNFAEALNSRRARDLNAPNIPRIVGETINPAEAGADPMSALLLLELDKANPVKIKDIGGIPHLSYDYGIFGRAIAKFDTQVPAQVIFPEWFAGRRKLGKPEKSDVRAFSMSKVTQNITPDIAKGMAVPRLGTINSARHAQLLSDTINGNWRSTSTPVNQGGLKPIEIVDGFDDNILSESLTKYSLKEIQDGAKDGSLVFYGLGDQKTGGKVYFGLKKNTDYEADYGFTHPELTKNETAIVGVMNNEFGYASKGVSVPSSVLKGIENGATVLDAYAVPSKANPKGFLPNYYAEFGFKELGRVKFDPKYVRDPEFGGSEQKYNKLLAQWRNSGWDENKGFPDLVIMKWQGLDAIRPNATRRFVQEGSQGFRLRETEDIVTGTENFFKQPTTGFGGRKSRSSGQSNIGSDKGQIRSGNQTPISEGFRRNIQSLTGASPEQLRAYGLLT